MQKKTDKYIVAEVYIFDEIYYGIYDSEMDEIIDQYIPLRETKNQALDDLSLIKMGKIKIYRKKSIKNKYK